MKHLRKSLLLLLACVLVLGCMSPALAYSEDKAQTQAEALKTLGLFQGTDIGFELERAPTRIEALVMLLRMTGVEREARFYEGEHPFTDAPSWSPAEAYIAYAYANGITKGVSDTLYDPNATADARTYVTLMLRALGYDADEAWDNWEALGEAAGLLPSGVDRENFLRGDAVLVSYAALDARLADGSMTLKEKLLADGVLSDFALAWADVQTGAAVSKDSSLARILAWTYNGVSEYLTTSQLQATEITSENMAYYLGVDNLKITEGLAVEPMMLAQAHSVCLIRLAEGEDVEAAKTAIAENVNPYKWICVGVDPENVLVANIGDLVLLVMDNDFSQTLMDKFLTLSDDANGITVSSGMAVEKRTYNESAVTGFAEKLNSIREQYLTENDVYYSVIPDKSYYLRDSFDQYLDHDKMTAQLAPLVDKAITPIALGTLLDETDYFTTDPHWKQERLQDVVSALGSAMDFTVNWSAFRPQTFDSFLGSYSRTLDSLQPETLTYLTSVYTEAAQVNIYGQDEPVAVYDTAKLQSNDPYSLFLSGLSPITVVESPKAVRDSHLVLFTDSFGASIAPLLLESYSTITLIDLRFAPSSLVGDYVDFTGADVLFLYSATLVNNSQLLR